MIKSPRAILVLLTGLNFLNYLDRFVLSAVLKPLKDDLQLSHLVGGSLAFVFLLGFFATSPLFGIWSDRAGPGGRRNLIVLGVLVWSAATIASGLARGPWSLVAARAVVGVGEASYVTIAPTIIDDVAPTARKGRWLAIFYTAIPVGSALGYIIGGLVQSATHDWRNAFFVAGGPGIVLGLLCMLLVEPPPSTRERPSFFKSLGVLFARPLYRMTVLGQCAYTFAIGGFAFWAPDYVATRYDFEPGRASTLFGAVTVVGGLIGTIAGGFLGDRATRHHSDDEGIARGSLRVTAIAVGLAAPLAAAAVFAPMAKGFFAVVLFCEIALFVPNGPYNLAVLRSVPNELRASAMAWSIFASHLLGDLWSPLLIGGVADHAPMAWAMLICPAGFALAALLWWRGRGIPSN